MRSPHNNPIHELNISLHCKYFLQNYQYSWCVDPLDGTKEFIKRNGQFTVNIALLEGDTPVMGVVQIPVTGKVYYAAKGQGSFVQDGPGAEPRQIFAKPFEIPNPQTGFPKVVILRVTERTEGGEMTKADIRDRIRQQLVQEKQYRRMYDQLRKEQYVVIRM